MKIYLACPYSHPSPSMRAARVLTADRVAAKWMDAGHIVFSPLSHSHPISKHCKVDPTDHDFWLRQDLPWLACCDLLVVLMLPGWRASDGIEREILEANMLGIPYVFVTHEDEPIKGEA